VAPEVVDLVERMAWENPHWGYLRIVGESRKLDAKVSATSMRRILRRHGLGPGSPTERAELDCPSTWRSSSAATR
jgi:transposase